MWLVGYESDLVRGILYVLNHTWGHECGVALTQMCKIMILFVLLAMNIFSGFYMCLYTGLNDHMIMYTFLFMHWTKLDIASVLPSVSL